MRTLLHNEIEPLQQQEFPGGAVNVRDYLQGSRTYGPGRQIVVSVQGCPQRCSGCFVQEQFLDSKVARSLISPDRLSHMILTSFGNVLHREDKMHMLVLVGGEPFAQSQPLAETVAQARATMDNIGVLVFSGYPLPDLERLAEEQPAITELLDETDMLIAGPYANALRDVTMLAGSSNQEVHHLTNRLQHVSGENEGQHKSVTVGPTGVSTLVTGFSV